MKNPKNPVGPYPPGRTTRPRPDTNMLDYLRWHTQMEQLDNYALARRILALSPMFGELGELVDIAMERLSPGVIERMAAEDRETK